MTAGARLGRLAGLSLALLSTACAIFASPPPPPPDQTAAPGAPVAPPSPTAAPPVVQRPPTPAEQWTAEHREKAATLEREGGLRRALDEWKIALTIDPADSMARERKQALEARIEGEIGERLRHGREALARGAHLEARRQFLAVLALDPKNRDAFEALRSEVRDVRFVLHTVRRGETLTVLAERYYGDRTRAEVIAETNQLGAATRPAVGAVLKIPEIPGVPFLVPETRTVAPPTETPEVNPLIAEARESLERGDYQVALADVERVLGAAPQNAEGLDLKKAILYALGKSQLRARKWDESYQTLTLLARLAPSYQDAPLLLRQARDRLVQRHYSEGLRLYREEKLEEAITAWRAVLDLAPDHAAARRNLDQAERVLKGLEQRRRQSPGSTR